MIPKALRVKQYPVCEKQGFIWVYWGEPEGEPELPKFFESFSDKLSYGSFRQHWSVHYSRMVENQLDVAHLPFVHHNTIGKGGRVLVNGPLVRIEDDLMDIWVFNQQDDGSPPVKAEDLQAPDRHPSLQFRFPNLWQNWISDDVRIVIAFVPVDDENGIMYGRFYQGFMKVPGLRELVNQFGVWSSIMIANQDRRIVNNQFPKKTDLKMGEKIMQSDRAILAYRRRRFELQNKTGHPETQ
jgi:phenylpropionate dioxygenase-like ring-hydroxylating dioxygenase large terminal subunit